MILTNGIDIIDIRRIKKTLDKVIDLKPTEVQPMMMHYKPQTRKYMIKIK
mgnify:CR=1 FL=1